jgi:IS605 OrfB family transposase
MSTIYPSLLVACNVESFQKCKTHSWYDMKKYKNYKQSALQYEQINTPYIDTIKIVLEPTLKQQKILQLWFNDCIDIYNITNQHYKDTLRDYKPSISWFNTRSTLNEYITNICEKNNLGKHTADYAVKHCSEMYKSAISNHKNMSKFNIKDLKKCRTRKNIVIEPQSVSKKKKENAIFITVLGSMKSNLPLNLIKSNSILQYNKNTKKYIIIVPQIREDVRIVKRSDKCGIDIGVRTFLTTYSNNESLEIGTSNKTYKVMKKYHKKLDDLQCRYDHKDISKACYKKTSLKYQEKLRNKIDDMHNKVASHLVKSYKEIIIGKVSTKQMVSNITGNLYKPTKRRLLTLSHYRFRMKLISMAKKYNANVVEVSEYLTSKTCCVCGNIKDDLGSSKTYNCDRCRIILDRDINSAVNIYENKVLSR